MDSKRGGIPGMIPGRGAKKSFSNVGQVPSERHVYVNDDVNVDVNNRYFEDSHQRATVWIDIEVLRILKANTSRKGTTKTQVINDALRQYFRSKGWE